MSTITSHPLSPSTSFPSPPLSPADERDLERVGDLELGASTPATEEHDPLLLRSKLATEEHFQELRNRKKSKSKTKKLSHFYT